MLPALRRPGWLVAAVVVLLLAALFVRLGLWQMDRLEERRAENALGESRIETAPLELDTLLDEAGEQDLADLEYRRVEVTGVFDATEEVLIRSQVELGQAGFHVITPLVMEDGRYVVLVNRGWVPLGMDRPPVSASPPGGEVTVEGWVELTKTRPSMGQVEPAGDQPVLNRVDIARIDEQTTHDVAPVYVVAMGEWGTDLPIPVHPPDFSDDGPHLAYAIQWFGFAAIGLIGFYFLSKKRGVTASSPRGRDR